MIDRSLHEGETGPDRGRQPTSPRGRDRRPRRDATLGRAPAVRRRRMPTARPADRRRHAARHRRDALVAAGIVIACLLTHRHDDRRSTTVSSRPRPRHAARRVAAGRSGSPDRRSAGQVASQRRRQPRPRSSSTVTRVRGPADARPRRRALARSSTQPRSRRRRRRRDRPRYDVARGHDDGSPRRRRPRRHARRRSRDATVPDVSGQTEEAAVTSLSRAGVLREPRLRPGQRPARDRRQARPSRPARTVPYHAHVQVNISRGPRTKPTTTVPNVVGRPLAEAVTALNGANLRLIYVRFPVTSRSQAGKIVQQSPLAGQPGTAERPGARLPRGLPHGVSELPAAASRAARLGSSVCVEMPTIASPRPAETRASTSASR